MMRFISLFSVTLILLGCASTQTTTTVSKNPVAVPTELYNTVNNTPISAQPISSTSPASNDNDLLNQLHSIDQALNAGQYTAAEQHLAQLTPLLSSTPELSINLIILQTKLALLSGQPQQALTWLNQLPPTLSPDLSQQDYLLQLRMQAFYRTNQVLLSAVTHIQDAELMNNFSSASNEAIWNQLMLLDLTELQTHQASNAQPLTAGWLSLALIAERYANDFDALQNNIATWQQNYSQHPANAWIQTPLNMPSHAPSQSIAVILPLSGNYAALGKIVQQGILQAYYASSSNAQQRISFYDSHKNSLDTIYDQIKANGNTFILGPLTKEDTEELLDTADETLPIISLNYTAHPATGSHFEFGLSPEDEAQQTAELAWRMSKSKAIIIAPKTSKGEQTAKAFIQSWSVLGGQVADQYYYANNDDFSKSISVLLGVSDSRLRQHQVHTTLQLRMNATTYFRKDADMIFLVADAKTARQIRPFLKFYSGDYLSVFATSSVYDGKNNVNKDKDLNDVFFCDMPAIFTHTSSATNINDQHLFFLGQDAYLLAMQSLHLTTYPRLPLMGTTGKLTIDPTTHNIKRGLTCAQFKDGRPAPVNTSR